jgi:nucleoside-specific outer membrane channel protein Tsx
MSQFTINPSTAISTSISFTPSVDIQINSIENAHALELSFGINDIIRANTEVKISEGYESTGFIPKVVVTYTEI